MSVYTQKKVEVNQLLNGIYSILELKLDDSSFDVEQLASAIFMSRASLHRKLKSITGFSPGNLIHIYRLQKAAQFLQEGFNSSQTAYKTGFESPAYFSKCFREHYRMSPIKYCQKL